VEPTAKELEMLGPLKMKLHVVGGTKKRRVFKLESK